ncbi:MAG: tautomerase family protein [Chloroflexi bacterium]|nr:tautomerase family protein [Chloroflexota bacterium]
MPMLEVTQASPMPLTLSQKRAFALEAIDIFSHVLNTPDGRLRLFFYQLQWDACLPGLVPTSYVSGDRGMIFLKITMLVGRTVEQKTKLMQQLTEAAHRHLEEPLGDIRVIIFDIPATDWSVGGVPLTERLAGR